GVGLAGHITEDEQVDRDRVPRGANPERQRCRIPRLGTLDQDKPGRGCADPLYAISSAIPVEEPAHHAGAHSGACQGDCRRRGAALRLHRQCAGTSCAKYLLPEVPPHVGGTRGVHGEPDADPQWRLPILRTADPWYLARIRTREEFSHMNISHMNIKIRPKIYWLAGLLIAVLAIAALQHVRAADPQNVRQAAVAGGFYPADPKTLSTMIDDMLAHSSPPPINDPILAVVAPHAGYQFSGPVAAYTYAALKGRKFSRVVVIAPSHYEAFDFTSIYEGDAYATPLGTVPVDKAFAKQLASMSPTIRLSSQGHVPTLKGAEHALEVELPWLQRVLGDFELVPIVMGDQSYESSRALGVALAKLIQGSDTLIVASSDLSHYHPYDEAVKIDHKTLNALQAWDYFSMSRNFEARVWEACGGAPIVAAMIAAERMGANQAVVLKYANSGDVTGDHSRVVGYSADVFLKTQSGKTVEPQFSLNGHEKNELLALARESVEYAVREKKA